MITRRAAMATGLIAGAASAMAGAPHKTILIRATVGPTQGTVRFGGREFACVLGRSGIVQPKHEGDGGTPAGTYPLREVRYRADRLVRPVTGLPVFETKPDDGWCDEPSDAAYNRLVRMPYKSDAEAMWRQDHAYDLLAVIGYNDAPVVAGAGSAIFLHVMRTGTDGAPLPTAGCIALRMPDLLDVLAICAPGTTIDIAMA